jgi:hypothetical protein
MNAESSTSSKVKKTGVERSKKYRESILVQGGEKLEKFLEGRKEAAKKRAEEERLSRENAKTQKQKELIAAKRAAGRERTRKCRENKKNKSFPLLGYNIMKAIPPLKRENDGLTVLRDLDVYLHDNTELVRKEFDLHADLLEKSSIHMSGIQLINGDRYEIFVSDADGTRGTGMFDWLIGEVEKKRTRQTTAVAKARIESIRTSIVAFANTMAKKDKRVGTDIDFQNHAIIISFDVCEQQDIHIDLDKKGHFQFGLLCTDNVFGTIEYSPLEPLLGDGCNLVDVWKDIPPSLALFLAQNAETSNLLRGFGRLLSPLVQTGADTEMPLPLGTLLSLPGEVVHAGPASDKFRAVMFFTGTPGVKHRTQQKYSTHGLRCWEKL